MEIDVHALATEISKKATVRGYNEFGSLDWERRSTEEEERIIYNIAKGALYSFVNNPNDEKGILDCAESTFIHFFDYELGEPHLNSYLTLYLPLKGIFSDIRTYAME